VAEVDTLQLQVQVVLEEVEQVLQVQAPLLALDLLIQAAAAEQVDTPQIKMVEVVEAVWLYYDTLLLILPLLQRQEHLHMQHQVDITYILLQAQAQ
jgi:hypothetical protein